MDPSVTLRAAMATEKPWAANLRATLEPTRGPAPRMKITGGGEAMVNGVGARLDDVSDGMVAVKSRRLGILLVEFFFLEGGCKDNYTT